ncbi:MAG: hypothetical protein RH859_03200 [Longimicrobiales bacterium]
MRVAVASLLLACAFGPLPVGAQAAPGWTVDLDGSIAPAEEVGTPVELPRGGRIWLGRDGDVLNVRLRTGALLVASLCVGSADTMAVLHASAALDRVDYAAAGGGWRPGADSTFVWDLREPGMDAATRLRRSAWFDAHGWVATTVPMGTPGETEFRIDLGRMPAGSDRVALGVMPADDPEAVWAWPAGAVGCGHPSLVRGLVPRDLPGGADAWHRLSPPG